MQQVNLNEFLAARDHETDVENDDDDEFRAGGPEIAVGSRGTRASRAGTGAVSVAAASIGAVLIGVQFRPTRRTLEELNRGEIIARKQDRGPQGSKTYIAIRKAATTPLPTKLLGPWFLGAKNKEESF